MYEATRSRESHPFGPHQIDELLQLVQASVPFQRRLVRADDVIFQAGQAFVNLYIANSGFYKLVNSSGEGREQVVGLHFKGDWMGLDGIAHGCYGCEAVALDTGEIWAVSYESLFHSAMKTPALLAAMHSAMSRELVRDHDAMLSLCTLPADARVAGFLRYWADALEQRGLRTDQVTLRMSRAEIGNYLGMTLETVSRALSRMARDEVIRFAEKGRREIHIPQVQALTSFIREACAAPVGTANAR
ncbi:Crp/Fnr family transcriptional regulator [Variovorax rhizosphaerae]|uniref:Helix-turn-helix domain-containing protein n=1 Tax=Variovorax rhizosphaerae TaxID=1836200 RepID=A0ABU8WTG8_9BURK